MICKTRTDRLESLRALFIHSSDTSVVSLSEALECANAWEGSQFLQLGALGHSRILQSPQFSEAIVKFILGLT